MYELIALVIVAIVAFIVGVDAAWFRSERRRCARGLAPSHEALLAAGRQLHEARARGDAVDLWRAIGRIENLCAQKETDERRS
jgi:hypothetical protein